jgi:hypothetical protein
MFVSKKKPKQALTLADAAYEDIRYKKPIDLNTYPDWIETDRYKYMRFYVTDKCIVYLVYYKHTMDCKTYMCIWENLAGIQSDKSFDSVPFYTAYDMMLKFVDTKQREQLKLIAR